MTTTKPATQAAALPPAPDRRAALAWVALQDAPTPTTIDILEGDYLWLTVQTLEAVAIWAKLFAGATYREPFHNTGATLHTAEADIAGWHVEVRAHIRPEPVEPLDDTTREALAVTAGAR